MIKAITDDFTGAAELGGIGLRYGLDVEICRSVPDYTGGDLLIIATDTRSMSVEHAVREIDKIISQLDVTCTKDLFKKTDSVLRGHVIAELEAIQRRLGGKKVLLVPCNPSLNRTISNGIYYVEGKPVHETSFVNEYQHNPSSSHIRELLNTDKKDISILRVDQPFTSRHFVIGEAQTVDQVESWAEYGVIGQRILSGGSDFFSAFLKNRGFTLKGNQKSKMASASCGYPASSLKSLFICGSASEASRQNIEHALQQGRAVCDMPVELFEDPQIDNEFIDRWAENIRHSFETCPRVIVAINRPFVDDPGVSEKLRECMARVTVKVLNHMDVRELFIEGGATAAGIIRRLEFEKFLPVRELTAGVVRMQVDGHPQLNMTLKPGSYPWPENVWNH